MTTLKMTGLPLSELGLENAVIRLASGTIIPFEGFALQKGETIVEAIQSCLPEDASLFLCREDAQAACGRDGHNWLGVAMFRVCLDCGLHERLAAEPTPPPGYIAPTPSRWLPRLVRGLGVLCLLLIILIVLQGCVGAPCNQCIGPYDIGLSSHREVLLRRLP